MRSYAQYCPVAKATEILGDRTGADRARALATILEAVAAGRFDARIAGRFALARAAEAHERLALRGVLGTLLLRA